MRDIGRRRQLGGEEALVIVPVGGDDLQKKVGLAGEHVRLAHFGPGERQRLERLQIGLGLIDNPTWANTVTPKPSNSGLMSAW